MHQRSFTKKQTPSPFSLLFTSLDLAQRTGVSPGKGGGRVLTTKPRLAEADQVCLSELDDKSNTSLQVSQSCYGLTELHPKYYWKEAACNTFSLLSPSPLLSSLVCGTDDKSAAMLCRRLGLHGAWGQKLQRWNGDRASM